MVKNIHRYNLNPCFFVFIGQKDSRAGTLTHLLTSGCAEYIEIIQYREDVFAKEERLCTGQLTIAERRESIQKRLKENKESKSILTIENTKSVNKND